MNTNLIQRNLWKKLQSEKYRHSFVSSQIAATVAAQIASTRVARGWTQKQLAEKAEMSQVRISVLEDPSYENFSIKTLKRLAQAFDVSLIVRFAPFSEMLSWLSGIQAEALAVPKFEDDSFQTGLENARYAPTAAEHQESPIQGKNKAAASAATGSFRHPAASWKGNIMRAFFETSPPQQTTLGSIPCN